MTIVPWDGGVSIHPSNASSVSDFEAFVDSPREVFVAALARLRVASVQGKTRQQADGTAGPLKIDTELQPSPSRAIPMQMNCTGTNVTRTLAGIDFSKVSGCSTDQPSLSMNIRR